MFIRFHLIIYILIVPIPFVSSITFNFPNITTQNLIRDIVLQGNRTNISNGGIELTGTDPTRNAGRAIYITPLHLWDNTTQKLASFSTNFTFVIDSNGSKPYGDGLTFFLARNNSVILDGGAMGLPLVSLSTPDSVYSPFVAVEFDTFRNAWDPIFDRGRLIDDHVGIDVSSVTSVVFQKWFGNVTGGGVCQAWITYDSVSHDLTVSYTGFQNNTVVRQDKLVYKIDLRKELPEWVIFGFSAATGAMLQRNTVRSWSFESSDILVDKNKELAPVPSPDSLFKDLPPVASPISVIRLPPVPSPISVIRLPPVPSPQTLIQIPDTREGKDNKVPVIVGLMAMITFAVVLTLVIWKRKRSMEDASQETGFSIEMNDEFEIGVKPKEFSYLELAQSTGDFAENNKLGEGGFGQVYRGFLKDSNTYIAVKRVSKSSKQGVKEYTSEVRIISQLRHKNLLQLTGWCHEKDELLLVYDYMENGSLDLHLFKGKSLLTWSTRYKIANGLASALWYLHEGWEQCVLHTDIKSSNVLLDSNFNAKLCDFGLAKLVNHEKNSKTIMLALEATKESDVFSFGVLALELACGRKAIEHYTTQEKKISLIEWVWELYGLDTLIEAVDPNLGSYFEEEEIKRLMIVGLWCLHPKSEIRPSMRQVIHVLNYQVSVPVIQTTMPVGSFSVSHILSVFGVSSFIQNLSSSIISKTS